LKKARNDGEVRGVILAGAGGKAFIAGADISELAHLSAVEGEESSSNGQAVLNLVENLGKPVIAAINGSRSAAVVKRLWLAPFGSPRRRPNSDSRSETWSPARRRRNTTAASSGWQRPGLAAHPYRRNHQCPGGLAHRSGQRSRSRCQSDRPRRKRFLKQIFSNAPVAIRYSLEAVNKGLETSLDEGLALEASFFGLCAGTRTRRKAHPRSSKSARQSFKGADVSQLSNQREGEYD